MPSNEYHFVTHWRLKGTVEEISEILEDPHGLARWWPSVYLDVREVAPPDRAGHGPLIALHTKGWLPYTLRWQFRAIDSRHPYGFTIEAQGDFDGWGVWSFDQDGEWVDVTYDWRLRAEKPLLKYLSPVLRPIFEANHRWAMARGEESLGLELERRRAASDAERARIAPPPGPTRVEPTHVLWGLSTCLLVGAAVVASARRSSGRRGR